MARVEMPRLCECEYYMEGMSKDEREAFKPLFDEMVESMDVVENPMSFFGRQRRRNQAVHVMMFLKLAREFCTPTDGRTMKQKCAHYEELFAWFVAKQVQKTVFSDQDANLFVHVIEEFKQNKKEIFHSNYVEWFFKAKYFVQIKYPELINKAPNKETEESYKHIVNGMRTKAVEYISLYTESFENTIVPMNIAT